MGGRVGEMAGAALRIRGKNFRIRGKNEAGQPHGATSVLSELDHIQIAMPRGEEARARDFYGRVLGLAEIEKPDNLKPRGGVWFELAGKQLHLGVDPDFRPATKAHPAFGAPDLAGLRNRLAAEGFAIIDDETLPGRERFYTADPFGNRIEFLKKIGP